MRGDVKKAGFWLQNGGDVNFLEHTEIDLKKGIWYEDILPIISHVRSLKMAELLVSHGAKMTDWRILPYVVEYGGRDSNVVRYLVEHGAKYCLMRIAAEWGNSEILEYLLANGAKINIGDDRFGPFSAPLLFVPSFLSGFFSHSNSESEN